MKDAVGEQYTGEFVMLSSESQDTVEAGSLQQNIKLFCLILQKLTTKMTKYSMFSLLRFHFDQLFASQRSARRISALDHV